MKKRFFLICAILLTGTIFVAACGSPKQANAGGEDAPRHVLLMGADSTSGASDTLLLLSFRDNLRQISALQIPRDLYLRLPNGEGKINSLLPFRDADAVVTTLERLLDLSIDGYAIASPAALAAAVDALGGIPFTAPFEMRYEDPSQGLSIQIPAGEQILRGQDFLGAWRYRSGYADGDLGRLRMQRELLGAAMRRLASEKNALTLWGVYRQISENVLTNLSKKDIISLCLPLCVGGDVKICFYTLPGDAVYLDGVSYFTMCRPATERLMQRIKGSPALVDRDLLGLGRGETMENVYFDPNMPFSEYVIGGKAQ